MKSLKFKKKDEGEKKNCLPLLSFQHQGMRVI